MGGEYLPDLKRNEVMIARITIASTTQDVTCVYARRGKDRITIVWWTSTKGKTLREKTTRTSNRPLTLGELESFFDRAWPIIFCSRTVISGAMGTTSRRCCASWWP
jgi:hypothetical protein